MPPVFDQSPTPRRALAFSLMAPDEFGCGLGKPGFLLFVLLVLNGAFTIRAATNQLPVWRVEGEVRQWSAPSPSTSRQLPRDNGIPSDFLLGRQVRFNLEFSEGGQWHVRTLSSIDQFSQLREFACDRGDLFSMLREAGGFVTLDQEKIRYTDAAEVAPGPIRFSTSYIGALWWLFCSRYAYQGQRQFWSPDFIDGNWERPIYCEQTPRVPGLGLRGGRIFFDDPAEGDSTPRFLLRVDQETNVFGITWPSRARVEKFAPGQAFGAPSLASLQEIVCTNFAAVPHPQTFRPALHVATGVIEERVPLWRMTYVGTNWLSLDELQKRVEIGKGIKADFLGRTIVQPRVRIEGPVF